MRRLALVFALLLVLPASAAGEPKDVQLDRLFGTLRQAASSEEAKPVEEQILARFRISGSPSIDLLMTRADAAFAAGDEGTAGRLAAAVTKLAPGFAEGWHVRALLQENAGDDKGALASLQKAVSLNPRHFAALVELGDKLQEYGDKDEALTLFRRGLALDPQYEGLKRRVDALTRTVEGQGI